MYVDIADFKIFEVPSRPAFLDCLNRGVDLAVDLGIRGGDIETLFVRSYLVVACRAAGKPPPTDGVHTLIGDDEGLQLEAQAARRLGFFGKSAIHPRQVPDGEFVDEAVAERARQLLRWE